MRLIPVESSMIEAIGYDAQARRLEVVFNTGRVYAYEGVPPEEYKALLAAPSKGSYMRSNIIGVYPDYPVVYRR